MSRKLRDPATDPQAEIPDFVYRLRRMGYPGNVRVEFPIYTVEDAKWCAKLMEGAAQSLIALARKIGPGQSSAPLAAVLEARAILVWLNHELQRRTSAREVKEVRHA